jgi:hypothetical protein
VLPGDLSVHLLRSSVRGLSVLEGELAAYLSEQMAVQTGHRASPAEQRSWQRSIPVLRAALLDAGLDDVEVLLEYQLPLTSKRADVVLCGRHPQTGLPSYLVVELKQWSSATRFEDSEQLVQIEGYGQHAVAHPAVQVSGYEEYLADFLVGLATEPRELASVVYLHNATDLAVSDLWDMEAGRTGGRMFTGQRRSDFVDFLRSTFDAQTVGAPYADALLASKVAPSRQLLAVAATEVQEREQFVLLDTQRDAYEHVLHAVDRARRANTKTAVVISGGPGSGKSVIALSVLGELARQGRTVMHATGSRSFTQTLRKVAGHRAPNVRKLFTYFNSFVTAEPNDLDCLILDEAHRIRATSVSRWTRKEHRTGRPQLDELLAAARVPVFLLDQYQIVRPGELGTAEDIAARAQEQGMRVELISLDEQFRCGGSERYVAWVEQLLGLRPGGPQPWTGDDHFDVSVVDSPHELEHGLRTLQDQGLAARMAAGFCWPWSDPRPDGTLVRDVQIDDWSRPWNLRGDRAVGGAPPSALWATDPAGFDQVGCIYTAQGFEYDHAGVIIGPDLVWRGDRWVSVRQATQDPELKNSAKVDDRQFDRLVRNVYKVLLTRGMQSVRIYSTDPPTREFLRRLVGG